MVKYYPADHVLQMRLLIIAFKSKTIIHRNNLPIKKNKSINSKWQLKNTSYVLLTCLNKK